jgi:aryl-alcohol dehydrogenase-like predicted oxidoreductase
MSRPAVTSPIVSATNLKQLEEISNAARLALDRSALELLNTASE